MTRVAYLVSHPIQYQAPLLRRLALEDDIELTVLFLSDVSAGAYVDAGFGQKIAWDVDLLQGYRSKVLPALGSRDALSFWRPLTLGVEQELRSHSYDVVWLHGYAHHSHVRALVTAHRLGLKILFRGESHASSSTRTGASALLRNAMLRRMFRHIDGFLAIGSANRDYYLSHGVPDDKIFLMPYAVDNARFQSALDGRQELSRALGLDPNRAVILYASKLQSRKRPWDLWRAYTELSPNGVDEPSPYLILAGDGSERERLEAAVRERSWNSVRFVGFQNQTKLPAYYALADVFVLPSEREPWGLVVNEAMNAAKAVIVSDQVGAAADLVEDAVNGYVVGVGDISALADRLRRVTADPDLARRMGAKSLERIARWDFEADVRGFRAALSHVQGN